MAIKPPELLSRIPSVSELLEKPPVRALVERWNRSVVAGGVRSFLDELRSDVQRRAADLPSIRELAERAARYVVSRQHHSLGVAINATGRMGGPPWMSTPLAETALEHAIALGREYAVEPPSAADKSRPEIESQLCRLTGAQAAAVVHSYAGAVWLTLSALAANREVLVARAEVGDMGSADSLPKLAANAQTVLHEVGTTNRSVAADYEAGLTPRTAAILKASSDSYRVVGDTATAELDELVALARDRELLSIAALGGAPLVDPPASLTWPQRSVQANVAAGFDLVIVRGDGLVGGPSCGILLGSRDVIRRIADHPLFGAWRLDPLRSAALAATVECYDSPSRGTDVLPAWQCLTVSVENLRNRAERMAPQLAHADGVADAVAVEMRSPLSAALPEGGWPSYGVALSAADGDVRALDERLRSARFPIFGRVENDRLLLDLRTVLPRQDKALVDALLDTKKPSETLAGSTAPGSAGG